jgi:hypothetical protein
MKRKLFILIPLLIVLGKYSFSQEFNKNIDKDSLFKTIFKELPEAQREEFKKTYEEANEQSKEFLLFMFSMPRSSKKELIDNYEKKANEISTLKKEYTKLVPDSLIIHIEFNPADKIISTPESVDLKIYRKNTTEQNTVVIQEWNLERESDKLKKILTLVGWNSYTLNKIKELLDAANCISIENGKITTIGFARSGMGKYFYKVFDEKLSPKEIEEYNSGCIYLFYKDNIVLEYGGGAVGSQCFPDK